MGFQPLQCKRAFQKEAGTHDKPVYGAHMYKLDLEKAEEPEIKLPTSVGS